MSSETKNDCTIIVAVYVHNLLIFSSKRGKETEGQVYVKVEDFVKGLVMYYYEI
jgi:hypothetical protein